MTLVKDNEQPFAIEAFQGGEVVGPPPGYLFDPVKISAQCPQRKRRRVIDMTLINNELSSLELRLNELWNVVDTFFIVESTIPFKPGALPKPLHLTNHWKDFAKFHSKMVLHVIPPERSQRTGGEVSLGEDWRLNFKIQEAQRDEMWRILKSKLNPREEDLIIKADLDEIPRPSAIEELACSPRGMLPDTPICLETLNSFYYYNFKCHIKFEWTGSPQVLTYSKSWNPYHKCMTSIANASIHCSSCFASLDDYLIKSISNSEPIRNPLLQTNNASIIDRVRTCKDFWLRPTEDANMELRESVDLGSIPMIVSKHPERWSHLMGKGPFYDTKGTHDTPLPTKAEVIKTYIPICETAQGTCVHPKFPNPETVTCPVRADLQATSTGAYILPIGYTYRFDQSFANAILKVVFGGSVLELGAGLGCYTYYLNQSGTFTSVSGYEGASNVNELTDGFVKQADLAEESNLGQFDWVICLEVAEHIPAEFEATFVANIIRPSPKGIVLSWALPDQPGSGHVNGKTNEYVISLMGSKGFHYDEEKTSFLRNQAELSWFKDTTMVFIASTE